ncbi:MAG TPA: cyanophycinase [Terriglobales bacterium]|nr:cyanophycinase [Terriglobales bacterium]
MRVAFVLLLLSTCAFAQSDLQPQYIRAGNQSDVVRNPQPGIGLFGGGKDQDAAFQWLCRKANGGDFLILRATGTDAYDPYLQKLCPELNSVATLIIHSREAANGAVTRNALQHAEAIFISGGDQSNYVKFWRDTALTELVNAAAARGVPVGGTSAGLAVLGAYAYSAMNDTVQSADALANPFHERVTIEHNFLQFPLLQHVITDSHFAKRDRMGRLVAFVSRIYSEGDHSIRGIGIDERSVVLLEPDGHAKVVGEGEGAYLLSFGPPPRTVAAGKALDATVNVLHVAVGSEIDWKSWKATQGEHYTLTASNGALKSSKPDGKVY